MSIPCPQKTTILLIRIAFFMVLYGLAGMLVAQPATVRPAPTPLQHLQNLNNLFSLQRYRLSEKLFSPTLSIANLRLPSLPLLQTLYKHRDYQPIWIQAGGLNQQGLLLFSYLRHADEHGLEPEEYSVSLISLCLNSSLMHTCEEADLELLLSDAYLRYSTHLNRGHFSPRQMDEQWYIVDSAPWKPVERLEQALASGTVQTLLDSLPPQQAQYAKLQALLKQYRQLAQNTLWPLLPELTKAELPKLEVGVSHTAVSLLRLRLWESGDLAVGYCPEADLNYFDAPLQAAVKHFQNRHGLKDDGVVGPLTRAALNLTLEQRIAQIKWNLERWRWLPDDLGASYILVNAAGFTLDLVQNSQKTLNMRVVVGRKDRQTPSFSANMSYLVLNPNWSVPHTIAIKDILPHLRQDPGYLARKNMNISQGGQKLDGRFVNWWNVGSDYFPFRISQRPGDDNALGKIKFMFPNDFDIYLHDTPHRSLFKESQRIFSSGCVRIEKPLALAETLLGWSENKLQDGLDKGTTQRVSLAETLPVYILYSTAWVDEDNSVQFRQDVYERDIGLEKAFATLYTPDPAQRELLRKARPGLYAHQATF